MVTLQEILEYAKAAERVWDQIEKWWGTDIPIPPTPMLGLRTLRKFGLNTILRAALMRWLTLDRTIFRRQMPRYGAWITARAIIGGGPVLVYVRTAWTLMRVTGAYLEPLLDPEIHKALLDPQIRSALEIAATEDSPRGRLAHNALTGDWATTAIRAVGGEFIIGAACQDDQCRWDELELLAEDLGFLLDQDFLQGMYDLQAGRQDEAIETLLKDPLQRLEWGTAVYRGVVRQQKFYDDWYAAQDVRTRQPFTLMLGQSMTKELLYRNTWTSAPRTKPFNIFEGVKFPDPEDPVYTPGVGPAPPGFRWHRVYGNTFTLVPVEYEPPGPPLTPETPEVRPLTPPGSPRRPAPSLGFGSHRLIQNWKLVGGGGWIIQELKRRS